MTEITVSSFPESTAEFLHAGGEMGQLTRAYDWSTSVLGAPAEWPQSLRTTLSILLNSKFPMFLFWGPSHICFYNDAYRPSLGNSGKHPDALGKPGADVWPEIWAFIKPLIDRVLNGGEATWNEDQLLPIWRNGRMEDVYWTFSYSPVNDETGKPAGVFVTCSETTQKVNNLKSLEASEEELKFAIDAACLGTWDFNPGTGRFTGNERLKDWFGLSRESEISLGRAIEVIWEPDRERVSNAIQKALDYSSGGKYDIEYCIVHPDTFLTRIVSAKGRAWFNEDKKAYRFNGTLEDVTERVAARKKIEEAEEKSRITIEAADLGTFEINLDKKTLTASPRFDFIYNVDHTDRHQDYINAIHPDDLQARTAAYQRARETGVMDYEARVIWKDGSLHWVRAIGKMYFNDKKEPTRVLGVVQDISEQKIFSEELSKQVKERTAELKRSNEDLQQFAHVTSHDLKEPVRKIKIFSNKLEQECEQNLPEAGKKSLAKIQKAADRMLAMIEGVLTFSSLNASDEGIGIIDLNAVFKNIISDLEILVAEKKAKITADPMPSIEGKAVLIYQLFYNIVYNALKFSSNDRPGIVHISASTEKKQEQDFASVMISDNGIGFAQEYADKIFNSFTRLHSKDKYEGTGLGLALCRKIAERHGGSISAAAVENEGAVFTVLLPLKQD